jgi:hypothetical protein
MPNWKVWRQCARVPLWEALLLSLDIEPAEHRAEFESGITLYPFEGGQPWRREFDDRALVILRNWETSNFRGKSPKSSTDVTVSVDLSQLCRFALDQNWRPLPQDFEAIAATPPANYRRWPWGEHETELLGHLAAAAKEWWSSYEPENPLTAPKSDEVAAWLRKERGVPDRVAEIMAQILRADDLRAGPRRNPRP